MVSIGTKIKASDNSGALIVKCIGILGNTYSNCANVGDTLIVSILSSRPRKKVSKGQVHKCILIRQRRKVLRTSGVFFNFRENSIVIIKEKNNDPIGNRIYGSVLQELRYKNCLKIMLLAYNIV